VERGEERKKKREIKKERKEINLGDGTEFKGVGLWGHVFGNYILSAAPSSLSLSDS
jgi:hypothetical protein